MSPLLITAAAESSKVAWYIVGGVLAVYAVVLAGLGLRRPEFPFGAKGARGVMTLSFILAVLAIAAAIVTS